MPIFRVQFRRDTTENWEKHNPILLYGEVGYEVTTTPGLILTKQGDGYLAADGKIYGTPWNDLPYCSGPPGPSPDYQWNGTILMFKKPDGEWGPGQDLVGPVPAHRWVGTALQFQTQTGSWGDLVDLQGIPGNANLLPATTTRLGGVIIGNGLTVNEQGCINVDAFDAIATPDLPGAVRPDGTTTTVDGTGLLSAIGENLQANSEEWITESGTWTAPVTGWYGLFLIGGGNAGFYNHDFNITHGGNSGGIEERIVHYSKGDVVSVVIGAGGVGTTTGTMVNGGNTSFGDTATNQDKCFRGSISYNPSPYDWEIFAVGAGIGGGYARISHAENVKRFYGSGGGAAVRLGTKQGTTSPGSPGAVRLRYYDPAKNNGPASDPPHTISHKATRTVNLYDPETGQGSVWREEDAPAKLAEGLITQEAWEAVCAQKAAAARTAWLANPDTEAERFEMLRAACERKLSQTDKYTVPDYPITEKQRQAVLTYRQAIRDLNHKPGAPWDGGGELTPWPEEPSFLSSLPNGQKSTNS